MRMRRTGFARRWALPAAAVAAALGFGGAQALAAPAEATVRACKQRECNLQCIASGATGGRCVGDACACYIEN